ncbi:MAG TPA: ATP-binding protein [Terracidiphilus sp.]|nr:ATP-binding protein [Terracidiphilus sp.]
MLRRALRAARRANSSTAEMRNLYELTRCTLQMNLGVKPGQQLAERLQKLFALDAVAIFDADLQEVYQAGKWSIDPGEMAQNIYHFETSDDDPHTGIGRRVVRLGTVPVGSLMVRGDLSPLTSSAVAAIIAITFDRYRATANETRIEAERDAERMRGTVLDSLAHAYKTPLTAIRAASSGLAEMGRLSPAQAELVALIDEQASLLNELTTRLLTTARLEAAETEASELALHMESVSAASLFEEVIAGLGERSAGANIRVEVSPDDLVFSADRRLMSMLLTQYVDNACKYSDAGSLISLRAEHSVNEALLSVHSFGAVIPPADRERIFDRYYRSSASATRAAGTGIGLSIAKRAVLAHGGSVWVASDETEGTTFFAAIPAASATSPTTGNPPETALERIQP